MTTTRTPDDRASELAQHRRIPWWAAAAIGLVCAVVGAAIIFRPFASLSAFVWLIAAGMLVKGIGDLVSARRASAPRIATLVGIVWIVGAVLVLAWASLTLRALAVVVGVLLVVGGLARIVAGVRGSTDQRIAAGILGVAEVIFGVLALSWPDLTLLVIAIVFGARTVMFGLSLVGDAWASRHGDLPTDVGTAPRPQSWWRRSRRLVASLAALVLALALLGVSALIHRGEPQLDAFSTPPRSVPDTPGQLIRSEPYTTAIPAGSAAWRILYTTTRGDGQPAVASGIVLRSATVPPGPRPVIAWAHGTTGFAENCAPSLLDTGLDSGALPAADQIVGNGWILVATDYVGLGSEGPHPYLIGEGQARSVLDAVRAARQLDDVTLSDRTVVWGHSQGGNAALWTGGLQPSYAPDVPLAGVAAMAPASDLPGLVGNLDEIPGGSIFASYVIAAYTEIYPDVDEDDVLRPAARTFVDEMAQRCLAEPEVLVSVGSSLTFDGPIFTDTATQGAFGRRLQENTPTRAIPAPLLLAQGETDPLVLPTAQAAYAGRLCDAGQRLDYRTYPGRDHVGVVGPESELIPDLVGWTRDRIDGEAATSTC